MEGVVGMDCSSFIIYCYFKLMECISAMIIS